MKVELHLHTNRYSPCAQATPAELMERMVQIGYEAVFITEHDAVWSDWEIRQLQAGFPDIRIFPGMELSLGRQTARHLLVLGSNDAEYLRLRDEADAVAKAREAGHLTVLAHPFRWESDFAAFEEGWRPDAIECRAGNQHQPEQILKAETAARQHDLRLVNSGDVHTQAALNRFWIETDVPLRRRKDIRRVVLNGEYANRTGA